MSNHGWNSVHPNELDPDDPGDPGVYWKREQCVRMNVAFANAMFAARRAGMESFAVTISPPKERT